MTVIINMHKTLSCMIYEGVMPILCTPLQVKYYRIHYDKIIVIYFIDELKYTHNRQTCSILLMVRIEFNIKSTCETLVKVNWSFRSIDNTN